MKNKATIYDLHRMCMSKRNCKECYFGCLDDCLFYDNAPRYVSNEDLKLANDAILKWCKENPVKTYKEDFLEKFPLTRLTCDNVPSFCRKEVYNFDGSFHCDGTLKCYQCWNKSMEEEK